LIGKGGAMGESPYERGMQDEVYAVLRVRTDAARLEDQVEVEEVVRTREAAEAEVRRLSALESAGGRYFWQPTRLLSFDEADGPGG
jgi:hypothetical protein